MKPSTVQQVSYDKSLSSIKERATLTISGLVSLAWYRYTCIVYYRTEALEDREPLQGRLSVLLKVRRHVLIPTRTSFQHAKLISEQSYRFKYKAKHYSVVEGRLTKSTRRIIINEMCGISDRIWHCELVAEQLNKRVRNRRNKQSWTHDQDASRKAA